MRPRTPPSDVPAPEALDEPIVVYVARWCGYCRAAIRLLERRGLRHAEVDVTGNAAARAWLLEVTGRRTVPQIFIHGRSIGGYTELAALDQAGDLPGT